jgi:hypothetical protein
MFAVYNDRLKNRPKALPMSQELIEKLIKMDMETFELTAKCQQLETKLKRMRAVNDLR